MPRRTGPILSLLGLLLAGLTSVLVMGIARQANEASRGQVRQVALVAAAKDILDQTPITPDMLVVKAFPADFAPAGAVASPDQVVGKIANGFVAKDQIVVAGQLGLAEPPANVSDRVPPGKVAIWLPMPDLMASAGVIKPGDKLDILLSVPLTAANGNPNDQPSDVVLTSGLSTQTTLQNIEVFRIGQEELNLKPAPQPSQPAVPNPSAAPPQPSKASQPGPSSRSISFLVDHQDAVVIKFIKDSGGTIDLVLRSTEDTRVIRTDAVTMDSLVERFRFRVPQTVAQQQPAAR
jgi:pilus assembly protein CpaB